MKVIAIALVVLGLAALIMGGVGYDGQRAILEVGSMSATVSEHRTNPIASVAGVLAVTGGVVLFVVTKRRRIDWRA